MYVVAKTAAAVAGTVRVAPTVRVITRLATACSPVLRFVRAHLSLVDRLSLLRVQSATNGSTALSLFHGRQTYSEPSILLNEPGGLFLFESRLRGVGTASG